MRRKALKRWVLEGTDYVYPRTTNKILEGLSDRQGRREGRHHGQLHAVRHSDWQTIVSDIKKFGSAGKKTAVVSTINGDANVPFYKELGNQGIKARTSRSWPSRSARKSLPVSTPSRSSAISLPGTTSSRSKHS
jgi:urea transport system substrate-binding protein